MPSSEDEGANSAEAPNHVQPKAAPPAPEPVTATGPEPEPVTTAEPESWADAEPGPAPEPAQGPPPEYHEQLGRVTKMVSLMDAGGVRVVHEFILAWIDASRRRAILTGSEAPDAGESAPEPATPARAFWRKMSDVRTEHDYEEKIAKARSNGTADELSVDVTIYGLPGDFDISIGGPHGTFESFCDFLEGAVDAYCRGETLGAEHAERDDAAVQDAIDGFLKRFASTVSVERRTMMRDELATMFKVEIAESVAAHGDNEPAVLAG